MKFLKDNFSIKSFLVLVMSTLMVGITATLIINPLALNPEKNSLINFVLGTLVSTFTTIINYYFKEHSEQKKQIDNPNL